MSATLSVAERWDEVAANPGVWPFLDLRLELSPVAALISAWYREERRRTRWLNDGEACNDQPHL